METVAAIRDAEIRALGLLDRALPDAVGRLVRLAPQLTGAREARVNVLTSEHQHTLASASGRTESMPLGHSVCARILGQPGQGYVAEDTRSDELLCSNAYVASGEVASYAAEKLVTSSGVTVGTLCVYDSSPRAMTDAQMAALHELGVVIMETLETRQQLDAVTASLAEVTGGSQELRRSNEHLAAFAGRVGHDVQSPLSGVLLSLELLEGLLDDAGEAHDLLVTALLGGQRLRSTVLGLLEYAAVGGELTRVPLDLDDVLTDVLDDLATVLGGVVVERGELPTVHGDEVQVRAVLQNLVASAVRQGPSGGIVRVDGRVLAGRTRVRVGSAGPAAPEDVLTPCRRAVEAHGGTLRTGPSELGGTEVWFELPDAG